MKERPSIIYLTYRPGGYDILADSLKSQTVQDYELIVVDDYTVERRPLVQNHLEKKGIYPRYLGPSKPKCFPETAFNQINAMNTGILLSTGDPIIFLHDYIWLPPDALANFLRHWQLYQENYCVTAIAQMWNNNRPKDFKGLLSIWPIPWHGSPEENGCRRSFVWAPTSLEFFCVAMPYRLLQLTNGIPECHDVSSVTLIDAFMKKAAANDGKFYVDKQNILHGIDHRNWEPKSLWHVGSKPPVGSTTLVERENCFDLKSHMRGMAYWLNNENIFEKPEYWCGNLGYRPGPDGIGYRDFPINELKAAYILERHPKGKLLDVGCAFGYLVSRLRNKGVDAWGVDISRYTLGHARGQTKPYLKLASAEDIPFKDNEFDMVVSFSTLEHLAPEILPKAISEIKRVGRRGVIAVSPSTDPHFDEDITHKTKQPLSWWQAQFPPQFEVRSDADEAWLKTRELKQCQMHRIQWVRSKVTASDTILEVGCAENPVWRETPFKVTTLDKTAHPDYKPDYIGEAEHLPFNEEFDIVSEGELLEHVSDPQAVLKEALRVARKKVILTVPWEHVWPQDLKPFWNPGHVRFYTPEMLEEELKPLGLPFQIEAIRIGGWAWLGAQVYKQKSAVPSEMVKINLGSFVDTIGSEWWNIDILNVQPYIPKDHKFRQWDLRQGIPWPDNSVDLIRASHILEHLTLEEARKLCCQMFKVLKPGGIVRISTPDAKIIMRRYINKDMSFFNAIQPPEYIQAPTQGEKLSRILFSGDYQHRGIYDFDMLKNFLEQAGFAADKIFQVGPGFSHSDVMQSETKDQHEIISLFLEAVK